MSAPGKISLESVNIRNNVLFLGCTMEKFGNGTVEVSMPEYFKLIKTLPLTKEKQKKKTGRKDKFWCDYLISKPHRDATILGPGRPTSGMPRFVQNATQIAMLLYIGSTECKFNVERASFVETCSDLRIPIKCTLYGREHSLTHRMLMYERYMDSQKIICGLMLEANPQPRFHSLI